MNINLHIERLVLEGLPLSRAQGPLVQRAVELELARLFAGTGMGPAFTSGGTVPRASGGAMQFAREATPGQLGTQIAQSVHEGLSK
ncbi:MAG TPA: hypothetical protein VHQ94_07085 [Pyrinomonadaceae bacterium]|jgi:hypothetical protein|nr:hypothetical protein [Pyrinomonadaceae bacterium]